MRKIQKQNLKLTPVLTFEKQRHMVQWGHWTQSVLANIAELISLAFPGFRASRDIKDFSYPACSASHTSAWFSTWIICEFASSASAISSRSLFLSSEVMACRGSVTNLAMLLKNAYSWRIILLVNQSEQIQRCTWSKQSYLKPSRTFLGRNSHLSCIFNWRPPCICILRKKSTNVFSLQDFGNVLRIESTWKWNSKEN